MSAPALETWRGCVNAWECDENRHMNVRFYAERAWEGLGGLAAALAMPRAFTQRALSTLVVTDMHIRFLREAREGAPLHMRGGVVAMGDSDMTVYQELRHGDGKPAATFTIRLGHVDPKEMRPCPWSKRTRDAVAAHLCTISDHGAPRSIDTAIRATAPTVARADELGVPVVGRFMVTPDHCDAFGRMRMELFLGRVSDAIPNLLADWRTELAPAAEATDEQKREAGGAVLEYRLAPQRWPLAGELIEVRSGVTDVGEKTNRITHWVLDPVSGQAWCTAEAVAVTFDLVTRKTIPIPDARRAALLAKAIPAMTI